MECPEEWLICSEKSVQNNQCIECNTNKNYYKNFSYDNNLNEKFVSCFYEISKSEKFYLDTEMITYEMCYKTCKECFNYGNEMINNCSSCIDGYEIKEEFPYNCVEKCPFYYYYDNLNHYICTKDEECPNNMFILKPKMKCVDNCYSYPPFIYIYKDECLEKCPLGMSSSKNHICINEEIYEIYEDCPYQYPYILLESKKCVRQCNPLEFFNKICSIQNDIPENVNEMIDNIKIAILDGSMDSLLDNCSSLILNENEIIYSISSESQQDVNNNIIMSIIKLNECQTILRYVYNIDEKNPLVIFKLDIIEKGLLIPIVEYEVYDIKNKRKLDLNYCNNTNIDIFLPVSLNEKNLFKYNTSSEYYNDICFTYTTENKTDIIIKDRRDEYINNNLKF